LHLPISRAIRLRRGGDDYIGSLVGWAVPTLLHPFAPLIWWAQPTLHFVILTLNGVTLRVRFFGLLAVGIAHPTLE